MASSIHSQPRISSEQAHVRNGTGFAPSKAIGLNPRPEALVARGWNVEHFENCPLVPFPKIAVLRTLLKSKLHRAVITDANVDYEGSISIPTDLMKKVDLWVGEKVLVTSITNGNRLETYVIPGRAGSGEIVINGAAAHLISTGHRVTIMAWASSAEPIKSKRLLLDEQNRILNNTVK